MPHFPATNGAHTNGTHVNGNSVNGDSTKEYKRVMLITNPRTCSNLLVRILNLDKQPATRHGGYHFMHCVIGMANQGLMDLNPSQWTDEQIKVAHGMYEAGIKNLEKTVTPEAGEDTKISFTKEHAGMLIDPTILAQQLWGHGNVNVERWKWQIPGWSSSEDCTYSTLNESVFPDQYLDQWEPVFLVRHPARAFESIYRSFVDVCKTEIVAGASQASKDNMTRGFMTLRWSRNLYDFYRSRGREPMIIDADDLVLHTRPITQKLADHVGFDGDLFQYEWQEATETEMAAKAAHMKRMLSSLDASKGIVSDPEKLSVGVLSAEEQVPRWTKEFGEKAALDIKRCVENAMPDYEYMLERRVRP